MSQQEILSQYSESHRERITQAEHERTFAKIIPWIREGSILDWGCGPGDDMRRIAKVFPSSTIRGCDVTQFDKSRADLTLLSHPSVLPYDDASFDTVLGAGVIEHAAHESASMMELWRVLKPNGRLILTYAPQRYSILEWVNRRLGRPNHPKRYTKRELRRLLHRHGFEIRWIGRHHSTPMSGPRWMRSVWFRCAGLIEILLGPFTQNLWIVGEKSYGIGTLHAREALTIYGEVWDNSTKD